MNQRLFINLHPGNTFLDKLTGKTKVRVFLLLIFLLIATWDIRLILPLFLLSIISLISIRPNAKRMTWTLIFILVVNLFNLLLMYLVEPDYGLNVVGGSTVLFKITDFYIVTKETMWYFLVRLMKFMATFIFSLTFIQCITPSEMAAGLYSIKVPYKICTITSLAFRYIPDITRDFNNIRISMQARGLELDAKRTGILKRLKNYVLILAPLVVSSFDRVGTIANAMDLRGFGKLKKRTYYSEHEDVKGDRIFRPIIIFMLLAFVGIIVYHIVAPAKFEVWAPWIK